jgi:hypothetical protein
VEPATSIRPAKTLLRIVTGLLILAAVTAAVIVVVRTIGAIRGDHTVTAQREVSLLTEVPQAVKVPTDVVAEIRISNATSGQIALAALKDLMFLLVAIPGLFLVRQLVRTARDGDPFIEPNIHRLRLLGYLLIFGPPLATMLSKMLEGWLALSSGFTGGNPVTLEFSLVGPVCGVGALVLAQVFAHGVRLREDVEGTV